MPRRFPSKTLILVLGVGLVACIAWTVFPAPTTLGATHKLELIRTDFGKHHVWTGDSIFKAWSRRILPKGFQNYLGSPVPLEVRTPEDSLVLWLRSADPDPLRPIAREVGYPAAIFSNGKSVSGRIIYTKNPRILALSFPWFELKSGKTLLEVEIRRARFQLKVRVPRNTVSREGTPPFIQRQNVGPSEVLFDPQSIHAPVLKSRSGEKTGWVFWSGRFAGIAGAPFGTQANPGGTFLRPPPVFPTNTPLRILYSGTEYVSLGFVGDMQPGTSASLAFPNRAREFGVQSVWWIGPGRHQLPLSGNECRSTVDQNESSCRLIELENGQGIDLRTKTPGVLVLFNASDEIPLPAMRLRERPVGSDGQARGARPLVLRGLLSGMVGFFPFPIESFPPRLELELVASIPPLEFQFR